MASEGASGKVRISELSFYGDAKKSEYTAPKAEAGLVQDGFKTVREVTTEGVNMYNEAKESVNHVIETGSAHSSVAYNQLREEEQTSATKLSRRTRPPPVVGLFLPSAAQAIKRI